MCSLSTFMPPPPADYVTVCERNAELVAVKAEDTGLIATFTQHLNYPEVDVTQDFARSSLSKESARSAFLEHDETLRKRILHAWYEHGLTGVLEQLSNVDEKESSVSWLTPFASRMLATVRWTSSLHGSLFPHLAMSNDDLVDEFSTNLHWREGVVRYFAWHPHTVKYAVALQDDSIKVFTAGRNNIVPILKHKLQKGISQLAWKPMSASVLAVACQSCVLIWHVDPTSLATRPSTSCVQVLTSPGHSPVTSLCWDPTGGSHLLTSSPADTAIMVWDVAMETHVALRRIGGGGVSLLSWSPDGSKVLAACPSPIFRVWETRHWTCEKWTKLLNRCQCACWSPDGRVLLFCTMDDPTIFSLTFSTSPDERYSMIGGSQVAVACADLSDVDFETDDGPIRIGGAIQSMVWDPKGERLAVSFKGKMNEVVALFQTRLAPVLQIMPCGFVRGEEGQTPDLMCFKPTFDDGALLTVVWSGGKVSFMPLYFLPTQAVEEHRTAVPNINSTLHTTTLFSES